MARQKRRIAFRLLVSVCSMSMLLIEAVIAGDPETLLIFGRLIKSSRFIAAMRFL